MKSRRFLVHDKEQLSEKCIRYDSMCVVSHGAICGRDVFFYNLDVYEIIDYDDSIRLVSQTCSDIEMIDLIMHHYLSQ